MTILAASVGAVLLSGVAIALAATDHARLAVAIVAAAVLLLAFVLSAILRRSRP